MTVSVSSFKARFREFALADADACAAALAGAEATVTDSFGSEAARDEVVMLATAEALALSPAGRDAAMTAKGIHGETVTVYGVRLQRLLDGEVALAPQRWGTEPST